MPLSSLHFLFILPLMLIFYWSLPRAFQRPALFLCSLLVYLYAGWHDLILLFLATGGNWLMHRIWPRNRPARVSAITINLLILAWFKYRVFLGLSGDGSLVIPLGISFYIFQLISYQVEIHQGILSELPPFGSMFLYIFFFPHHQAGPIMRPSRFIRCFEGVRNWYHSRFVSGLLLLAWGLFKKIWIADLIANTVERQFSLFRSTQGGEGNLLYLGILYGIQIYADFSGYSDIAIGIGRLFGFKLDRNFRQPYLARNPTEFWSRWHITLSTWLRDHLYIPLGGNRSGLALTMLNLMVVMTLGGLWHGASWSFILWGFLHGLILIAYRLAPPLRLIPAPVRVLFFQILIGLSWLPFKIENLGHLYQAVGRSSAWLGPRTPSALGLLLAVIGFSWWEGWLERQFPKWLHDVGHWPRALFLPAYSLVLYLIMIGAGHATTFIYQRF